MTRSVRSLRLALLATGLVGVGPAAAVPPPAYLFSFGASGTGAGHFVDPVAITGDATRLWVLDAGAHRVAIFDSHGVEVGSFGSAGSGPGQFNNPVSLCLALDGSDLLSISDAGNNRVEQFHRAGGLVASCGAAGAGDGQFNGPVAAVAGLSTNFGLGRLYVADRGNHRIQVLRSDNCDPFSGWGAAGTADGQFDDLCGLAAALDPRRVYAADRGTRRIQVFDDAGQWLGAFGAAGAADGQFQELGAIGTFSNLLWAADTGLDRMQLFDQAGNWQTTWGAPGSGPGQFNDPVGMAYGPGGRYYVLDRGNRRVQVFDPAGSVSVMQASIATTPAAPTGLAPFLVGFQAQVTGGYPPFTYAWDLGDGATTSAAAFSHRFQDPGVFNVTLRVRDALYPVTAEATATMAVTVRPPAGRQPAIVGHLGPVVGRAACTSGLPATCAEATTAGRLLGAGGAGYFLYVLVDRGDLPDLAGVQFGVSYQDGRAGGMADHVGVDVFAWHLCADLQFASPGAFGQPGSGNLVTWDHTTHCQAGGPVAAGYFYVAAYSADTFRITPRPADNLAAVTTCASAATELPGARLGRVVFSADGATPGFNPCLQAPIPVRPVTWTQIKTLYH